MSVTFAPAKPGDIRHHLLKMWCKTAIAQVTPAPLSAAFLASKHSLSCKECAGYGGAFVEAVYEYDTLTLSNTNARQILELLGFNYAEDDGLGGQCSPEDFLGRVLLGLALEPVDAGRPTLVTGQLIRVGTHPGYRQDRLKGLERLALWAKEHNTDICWG